MSAVVVPFPTKPVDDEPACAEYDPDWWFDEAYFAQAVTVCRRCPVRSRCLNQALDAGETLGVWGGLTPAQRAALPVAAVVPIRRGDRRLR
jgi:WhiB family redox-sensing transcriptional regulator